MADLKSSALFIFILLGAQAYALRAPAKSVKVVIENMAFNPKEVVVHAGDTITWQNKDLVPHTVTSDFDSGTILPEHSWSLKVKRADSKAYKCRFHPTMSGAISVAKP